MRDDGTEIGPLRIGFPSHTLKPKKHIVGDGIGNEEKAESYYPIFAFQPFSYVIEPPHSPAHCTLSTVQHILHYALHARSAATILLNQNQSMSSVLQKIISLSESEASSDSKKAVKRTRDTDDYIFQSSLGKLIRPCRDDKYFRTR